MIVIAAVHLHAAVHVCKTRGAVAGNRRVSERHASLRHGLPRRRNGSEDAFGHDRLVQGGHQALRGKTHANTWGHESFQVQKASVDTKSLQAYRVTREGSEGSCASMCQALLCEIAVESRIPSMRLPREAPGRQHGRRQEAMLLGQPRYAGSWWPSRLVRSWVWPRSQRLMAPPSVSPSAPHAVPAV